MSNFAFIKTIFAVSVIAASGTMAFAVCQGDSHDLTLMMYRPANGVFYEQSDACSFVAVRMGDKNSVTVPGDYDGDKVTDMAIYNSEAGVWTIRHSSNGKTVTYSFEPVESKQQMSNTPVQADYDGDGRTDIAVWHAGSGQWSILLAAASFNQAAMHQFRLGGNGDVPVPADYDGDGRADIAVFRTADGTWSMVESRSGKMTGIIYGRTGEFYLAPADYTGDGKADLTIFQNGRWSIRESETGEIVNHVFGSAASIPVPADNDDDGTVDLASYSDGKWLIQRSTDGGFEGMEFGTAGDIPLSPVRAVRLRTEK